MLVGRACSLSSWLWRSDGTPAGTVRIKTINASNLYPWPNSLTAAGDGLFFTASDGVHGAELWYSDGTEAGTRMVKDITPGSNGSSAYHLTGLGSTVIFHIYVVGNEYRYQLWRSDGSEAGTYMLKDRLSISSDNIVEMNNALYFGAYDQPITGHLWRTDGTVVGTVQVISQSLDVHSQVVIDDTLYFAAGHRYELWRSDGTEAGSWRISTVNARALRTIDNRLYFTGWDTEHGYELWRSNGTAAGTTLVQDIVSGFDSSFAGDIARLGDRLLLLADDHVHGQEPWALTLDPDTAPPIISAPASLMASTSDPAGTPISYTATVSDDYDAAPSLSCAPASGSIFPIGATTVTCTASDISGNTASASFTVTVALRQQLYLPLVSR